MSDTEFMVTQKEAADFLNVSTKSISRYRKRGLPYKLILNPVTGKQEVRFRYADLERWDEGRQLLATYARDGEPAGAEAKSGSSEGRPGGLPVDQGFLPELLAAYKEQIELLRDQLEDMREQLARRDRQIDDLMRLMVGLQLEYKPMPTDQRMEPVELFESIELPERFPQAQTIENVRPSAPTPDSGQAKKIFSREQLSASILRLRRKGKSFDEITRGLNRIEAATLSGHPEWTVAEVRTLLPSLVDTDAQSLVHGNDF